MSRSRPQRPLRVAIIGAGLGGLAAAVKLRQRTTAEFVIFEQSAGIGGTWRDNRYPGCEVDIHSHAYSYSFLKYEWPRTHATQPELLAYAEHVVTMFGLAAHLRLNTQVTSLTWEEPAARVRAVHRRRRAARVRRGDLGDGAAQRPALPGLAGARARSPARASTPRGGSPTTT